MFLHRYRGTLKHKHEQSTAWCDICQFCYGCVFRKEDSRQVIFVSYCLQHISRVCLNNIQDKNARYRIRAKQKST